MISLTDFPTEILQVILSYVGQRDLIECARVHTNVTMPAIFYLWCTIYLKNGSYCGFCFLYTLVMARHSIGRCIRHLHLVDFPWSDTTLRILIRQAPLLTTLVLDDATRVTDASMRLMSQLANLTSLQLWNCRLSPNSFSYFVDSSLEKLMLAPWVDEDAEEDEEEEEVSIDLTGLHQLIHLQLHGGDFNVFKQVITLDSEGQAHYPWPRLTSVILEGCPDMDDIATTALLHDLPPGLTCLGIRDASIGDSTLEYIAKYQPGLVELDISYNHRFTRRGIQDLAGRCPQLCLIELAYCEFEMQDFPEAGKECQGTVMTTENTVTRLDHLNAPAIQLLRRGN